MYVFGKKVNNDKKITFRRAECTLQAAGGGRWEGSGGLSSFPVGHTGFTTTTPQPRKANTAAKKMYFPLDASSGCPTTNGEITKGKTVSPVQNPKHRLQL